ncbi:MAG: lyase family protein, partial [Nitrospinota bacterium]
MGRPPSTRVERDPLGEVEVPAEAYYGPQTARALKNFPISGLRAHGEFIRALAQIKRAAAEVNCRLGALEEEVGRAIAQAAREVAEGGLAEEFQVDVFQAGAGTSLHMNMNEVLANRAAELLGGRKGDYRRVHPNDHVNFGQSTNDVFPTAMRLACLRLLGRLLPELSLLAEAFEEKGEEFGSIIKSGRTHMQDAAPVSLGREFGAYGRTMEKAADTLRSAAEGLHELGIGGSAVGTGLNTLPSYREGVVERLRELTGMPLRGAPDLMEAMNSMAPFVTLSAALRGLAVELTRIANDL